MPNKKPVMLLIDDYIVDEDGEEIKDDKGAAVNILPQEYSVFRQLGIRIQLWEPKES